MRMSVKILLSITFPFMAGCYESSTSLVRKGVVLDKASCKPDSVNIAELKQSQMACHLGVTGDGAQVVVEESQWKFGVESDTATRQLLSIYIYPGSVLNGVGEVPFSAFFSIGQYELTGKTGCVGVLETGHVKVEPANKIAYDLIFRLVSPLDWKDDCAENYHAIGVVDLVANQN